MGINVACIDTLPGAPYHNFIITNGKWHENPLGPEGLAGCSRRDLGFNRNIMRIDTGLLSPNVFIGKAQPGPLER
jgi:hypothetical protein